MDTDQIRYRRARVRADLGTAIHLAAQREDGLLDTLCGKTMTCATAGNDDPQLRQGPLCDRCFPRQRLSAREARRLMERR